MAREAEKQLRPLGARRLAGGAARLSRRHRPGLAPPALAIHCLGGFAVLRSGEPVGVGEWNSRKARDLVKILISREGRPVHRSVLVEALWPGEDPARTGSRLSVTLSTARAVLDPGKAHLPGWFLAAEGDAVWIDVDHVDVDVLRFGALAAAAEAERQAAPPPPPRRRWPRPRSPTWAAFAEDPTRTGRCRCGSGRAALHLVGAHAGRRHGHNEDTAAAVRCYLRVLEQDPYDEHAPGPGGHPAGRRAAGRRPAGRTAPTACAWRRSAWRPAPFPG